MKRTILFLSAIITLIVFAACDDNTDTIGSSVIPESDTISIITKTFEATTKSVVAKDSILANTNRVYLGRYTDPESNTITTSDFVAQFNCVENYGFPSNVAGDSVVKIELKLFYSSFYGDSLNTMQCEVYELDNTLLEGVPYYTNINPEEFYDTAKEPLAKQTYCAVDITIPDSVKLNDDYTPSVTIPLPKNLGNRFIKKYLEVDEKGDSIGKLNFANSEEFINNVFKGVYVKSTQGDGTVINISMARLNVYFQFYTTGTSGKLDSLVSGIATFSSTREVLQVNKFSNIVAEGHPNNSFEEFIDQQTDYTYLKTPAGVFTEVTLPIKEIAESCDTLNAVKIVFTRYNDKSEYNKPYSIPYNLLMVRKADMYSFFLKNKVSDKNTSYISSYNSSSNEYAFNNIAKLIKHCSNEYMQGIEADAAWEEKNPDWNKVMLIPVSTSTDNMGNVISVTHNLGLTNTKLRGGSKDKIKVSVVTSKFED